MSFRALTDLPSLPIIFAPSEKVDASISGVSWDNVVLMTTAYNEEYWQDMVSIRKEKYANTPKGV